MKFNPDIHQRRSIRLKGHDYSQAGAYFVTICTRERECLFGDVVDGEMQMNDIGRIVQDVWHGLPRHYSHVESDAFIVMPNHVHGILIVGAQFIAPDRNGRDPIPPGVMNHAPTLGEMVRRFKAVSTRRIHTNGCAHFAWQHNYYEHVIRNEDELIRTSEYILNNPARWAEDEDNPIHLQSKSNQCPPRPSRRPDEG